VDTVRQSVITSTCHLNQVYSVKIPAVIGHFSQYFFTAPVFCSMLVVRYCDLLRTDPVFQTKLLGCNQISLASFNEWSMQPVILAINLVSLKCIPCSATVDLPGLNSLVSCACSLYLVSGIDLSVKYTPCHIHMVCSTSPRTYGQHHPSLVSTSVHYLWRKHEI
jgi:hypothetical protein